MQTEDLQHISGAIEMQIHIRYILSTSPRDTYFKQFHLQCKCIMGKYCALQFERSNLLLKVYKLHPDFCLLRTRKTLDLCGCTDRIAKNTLQYKLLCFSLSCFQCPKRCSLWLSIVSSGRQVLLCQSFSPCSVIHSPY